MMRRNSSRNPIGLILSILLFIEIGVAVALVQAQPGGFAALFDVGAGLGPERTQVLPSQSFDLVNNVGNLTVENRNGKIELVGDANATQLTITATKVTRRVGDDVKLFNDLQYDVTREGNNIKVTFRATSLNLGNDRIDFAINTPKNLMTNLKSINGNVTLTNFENNAANHKLETTNGNITVNAVKAATIDLDSTNGSLNMDNVMAGVKAETINGRIQASNSTLLSTDFETTNGRIEFSGSLELKGEGSIKSLNGSVEIRLNPAKLPRFDVSTSNGSINLNLATLSFERNEKKHIVTNGTNPVLKISTNNGSISINGL